MGAWARTSNLFRFAGGLAALLLCGSCMSAPPAKIQAGSVQATSVSPGVVGAVRRTSESQYRHAIADLFGADVTVNARFEPDPRLDGLTAIGASSASVSAGGFQQYFSAAKSIATQALDEKRRARTMACTPVAMDAADDACAEQMIRVLGRKLFRRALTEDEVSARVQLARTGAEQAKDFHAGLQLALVSLMTAPDFLFRIETGTPAEGGMIQLDAYSRAARISYLLWDAPPDEALLAAAESGSLMTQAGLKAEVERLAASPRVADGVRAFFSDLMQLDLFETLSKDAAQYPKFSQAVAASAKEQTLRVLVDLLAVKHGDYRDIFTSRETFINRPLGAVYRVPFASSGDWAPYTFDEASGQSGVLTQVAFLSMFSHPGRSSPTKRGAAISEIFLCQPVPQPPADVDLSALNDDKSGAKTVRERLELHRTQPLCAVCHSQSDPPGLALEQFDGIGQLRFAENGAPIDVNVEFSGRPVSGARGLGLALRDDPRVPSCLVNRAWAYGHGRPAASAEKARLDREIEAFAASGYRVPELLARIAASEDFHTVLAPKPTTGSGG